MPRRDQEANLAHNHPDVVAPRRQQETADARAHRQVREAQAQQIARERRNLTAGPDMATSPGGITLAHAQAKGYNPPEPGPFATPADAALAQQESHFHSPQTLGGLGRQASEIATGIDPADPLKHGPLWLGVNLATIFPIYRGPRALLKAAELAKEGMSAKDIALAARASMHEPGPLSKGLAKAAGTVRAQKLAKRVDKALQTSPVRADAHAHFDATAPTPESAQAQKDLYDAHVHALALAVRNRPAALKQVFEHLSGGAPIRHLDASLGDLHVLYQHVPPEVPAMPARIKGGEVANRVYKLVKQGAPYRDWYQRASWIVQLVARDLHVPYDEMAQIVAITSQGANPTFNLRLAIEAVQSFREFGHVKIGPKDPYIFDPKEVEAVLTGGTWEGRKRSSFYQNITRATDHVTVDRHIAQMLFKTDSPTEKQYQQAEKIFRGIAAQLGWSPKEVQAAAWVPWKAGAKVSKTGGDISNYLPSATDAYEQGYRNAVTAPELRKPGLKPKPIETADVNRVRASYEKYAGQDLKGLPSSVKFAGHEIPVHSNAEAQSLAEQYMRETGMPYDPPRTYAKVDPERARRIAEWYDAAVDAPNDPAVRAAYDAMARETLAQYKTITDAGYTFEFWPAGKDPYPHGPRETMLDLQQNKHMYVFPTTEGYGTLSEAAASHPLLGDSGLVWNGQAVTHNDVFRAVHDFFGHFKEGVGFRADGEENAWRAHSAMYSAEARPAMTAETRGQNSWVNFGPHGEANRTAKQGETVYADQKAVLAPDWVVNEGAHDPGHKATSDLTVGDILAQAPREPSGLSFGEHAKQLYDEHTKAALDIARLLPEDQWPSWVRNQIRTQAVGREAPIELPNPPSPLDQTKGPTQRYMEFLAGQDTPDTFPGSWLKGESGQLTPGAFGRGEYKPFRQKLNDLNQQVPQPRSRISFQLVYKPIWKASRALQKSQWVRDTPGARILTSGERIIKQAGRAQRVETGRRTARFYDELHTIAKIHEGSPEDVANFWYAQLPPSHRNGEGLMLMAQRQRQEIKYITSGQAEKDLKAWEAEVKANQKSDPFQAMQDMEQIKLIRSDLPLRVEDASASVASLEKLAANAPAVNEKAISAADALMADRERILEGRLKSDRAEARKGLVAKQLGLEPSGLEVYLGHRLAKPDAGGFAAPSGGVGRVKTPQGVGSPNQFVLASTGRLRQTLHVALEDWHSAQVFEQANIARNDLAKAGTKFEGHVPKGHMLVNPKGRTVPAHWKTDELAQFQAGYEDTQTLREQAKQILDGFLADGSDPKAIENLKRAALEDGVQWSELRVVPKRYVDRYYKQFKSSGRSNAAAKTVDAAVDAIATSIVFARVGYIPKNFAQNVIMMVPHQGPMLLVNATRAAQALADPELRHLIHAEIGFSGPMAGLKREGVASVPHKVLGKVAGAVGKVADDPARFSAFLHEAAAEGVVSKVNPLLTERDRAALLDLFTNPAKRPLLNDIRNRATEAMADFTRMTPDQAKIARRFLIIPGWLMAGSRYPFHFAINHPVRSALMAYIAMGEPGAPEKLQFNKPLDEYFTHNVPGYLQGIPMAGKVFRTGALTPVGTPWDLGQAAVQTARGKNEHDYLHQTAFDYAQPLVGVGVDLAQGGGLKSLERLAPNEKFVQGMIHPKASPTYPEDATRLGRLKREAGIFPIKIGTAPGTRKAGKTPEQKAQEWTQKVHQAFGQVPDYVTKALSLKVRYQNDRAQFKTDHKLKRLTPRQEITVKLGVLATIDATTSQQGLDFMQQNPRLTYKKVAAINNWLDEKLGWNELDRVNRALRAKEHASGSY